MPWSTAKDCRCGSSFTPLRSRIATGPGWCSTRYDDASRGSNLSGPMCGYNAWQVDAAVAKVPLLRMEIVKRSDDMKGFAVLPRRWVVERTFSWVRAQPASHQGLREPRGNPSHFRHSRLHPARSLAAGRDVGRGPRHTMTKIGKPDYEGTFVGTRGNGRDAPIAAVRR
jgi:transposase